MAQAQETLELLPTASLALQVLANCYLVKGMYEKVVSILQQIKDSPMTQMFLAQTYSKTGKKNEAQKILNDFLEISEREYFSPFKIAVVYAELGETDKVFEWLEKSVEEHDPNNIAMKFYFNDLHSDPRWAKLMEKMNFTD